MGVSKKCQNLTFKVNFLCLKLLESFWLFFSLKNTNLGANFLSLTFLISSMFKSLYFLKWCPVFDSSPLLQVSKFNNFFWVCWFLTKNLSNLVSLPWKLHNRYCHNLRIDNSLHFVTGIYWLPHSLWSLCDIRNVNSPKHWASSDQEQLW